MRERGRERKRDVKGHEEGLITGLNVEREYGPRDVGVSGVQPQVRLLRGGRDTDALRREPVPRAGVPQLRTEGPDEHGSQVP